MYMIEGNDLLKEYVTKNPKSYSYRERSQNAQFLSPLILRIFFTPLATEL